MEQHQGNRPARRRGSRVNLEANKSMAQLMLSLGTSRTVPDVISAGTGGTGIGDASLLPAGTAEGGGAGELRQQRTGPESGPSALLHSKAAIPGHHGAAAAAAGQSTTGRGAGLALQGPADLSAAPSVVTPQSTPNTSMLPGAAVPGHHGSAPCALPLQSTPTSFCGPSLPLPHAQASEPGYSNLGAGAQSGYSNLGAGVPSGFDNLGAGVPSGLSNLSAGAQSLLAASAAELLLQQQLQAHLRSVAQGRQQSLGEVPSGGGDSSGPGTDSTAVRVPPGLERPGLSRKRPVQGLSEEGVSQRTWVSDSALTPSTFSRRRHGGPGPPRSTQWATGPLGGTPTEASQRLWQQKERMRSCGLEPSRGDLGNVQAQGDRLETKGDSLGALGAAHRQTAGTRQASLSEGHVPLAMTGGGSRVAASLVLAVPGGGASLAMPDGGARVKVPGDGAAPSPLGTVGAQLAVPGGVTGLAGPGDGARLAPPSAAELVASLLLREMGPTMGLSSAQLAGGLQCRSATVHSGSLKVSQGHSEGSRVGRGQVLPLCGDSPAQTESPHFWQQPQVAMPALSAVKGGAMGEQRQLSSMTRGLDGALHRTEGVAELCARAAIATIAAENAAAAAALAEPATLAAAAAPAAQAALLSVTPPLLEERAPARIPEAAEAAAAAAKWRSEVESLSPSQRALLLRLLTPLGHTGPLSQPAPVPAWEAGPEQAPAPAPAFAGCLPDCTATAPAAPSPTLLAPLEGRQFKPAGRQAVFQAGWPGGVKPRGSGLDTATMGSGNLSDAGSSFSCRQQEKVLTAGCSQISSLPLPPTERQGPGIGGMGHWEPAAEAGGHGAVPFDRTGQVAGLQPGAPGRAPGMGGEASLGLSAADHVDGLTAGQAAERGEGSAGTALGGGFSSLTQEQQIGRDSRIEQSIVQTTERTRFGRSSEAAPATLPSCQTVSQTVLAPHCPTQTVCPTSGAHGTTEQRSAMQKELGCQGVFELRSPVEVELGTSSDAILKALESVKEMQPLEDEHLPEQWLADSEDAEGKEAWLKSLTEGREQEPMADTIESLLGFL